MIHMNKRILLSAALLFAFGLADAQFFYYKDVLTIRELTVEMAKLKENKVRTVKVNSFDRPDEPSEGFFCEKKIKKDYSRFETFTRSYASAPSLLTSWFRKDGLLERTTDSSDIYVNTSSYDYNDAGQLTSVTISSVSHDDDESNDATEQRLYFYNDKKILKKMVLVKNNKDSVNYEFTADEKGNIIEEKESKSGKSYYYYYDQKNRLTDIVYFNTGLRKLLPVMMFEYNAAGVVSQMITLEEGSVFYYTWRYTYDNGLKSSEKCFMTRQKDPQISDGFGSSSPKTLMGIVTYEYN